MSEYQYYEFRAIDRPLTDEEMAAVRALSTRAAITPPRFVNVYHFGDFRGDPLELMKRYYDAHLCVANWGARDLMLRFPRALLDPVVAARDCVAGSGCAEVQVTRDHTIVSFSSQDETDAGWIADAAAEAYPEAKVKPAVHSPMANGNSTWLWFSGSDVMVLAVAEVWGAPLPTSPRWGEEPGGGCPGGWPTPVPSGGGLGRGHALRRPATAIGTTTDPLAAEGTAVARGDRARRLARPASRLAAVRSGWIPGWQCRRATTAAGTRQADPVAHCTCRVPAHRRGPDQHGFGVFSRAR